MTKFRYFLRSVIRFYTPKQCPYCGSTATKTIDRKFGFTTLNECATCHLYFRHPHDTTAFNHKFYQKEYEQKDGITTDLPSEEELNKLVAGNFSGSPKDFSEKIKAIQTLAGKPFVSIIDYGANWGYASYQFKKAGFSVQPYEISVPRAKFGKKLGLDILTNENSLQGNADVFFNSHVIEHLPNIKNMFLVAQRHLKDDGYFVSYCPNGSGEFKSRYPETFHRFWGQVHPNYLSSSFFAEVFKDVPYLIGSDHSKPEDITGWDKKSQKIADVSGHELFVFAKIKNQRF